MNKEEYLEVKTLADAFESLRQTEAVQQYLKAENAKKRLDKLTPQDLIKMEVYSQPSFEPTAERIKELFVKERESFVDWQGNDYGVGDLFEESLWNFKEWTVRVVDSDYSEGNYEEAGEAYSVIEVSGPETAHFKIEGHYSSYGGFEMNSVARVEKKTKKIEVWE